MIIRNNKDLRKAYTLLRFYVDTLKTLPSTPRHEERIVELKRDIRKYTNTPVEEGNCICNDWDSAVVVKPFPDFITSEESAEEWFMNNEYMASPNSPWDCTGKMFTCWFKVFKRRGKFWFYHSVALDV